jgi:hypothetical protein
MIFYCRISECRAQRLKTILNLPTCWEQISAFSKSQKIDSFDQYYTKRKSDYINLQIISREWKYYMVALMNFERFDRYGGYRVLMFKFNNFQYWYPVMSCATPLIPRVFTLQSSWIIQSEQSSFSSHAGIIRWSISELFGEFIFLNPPWNPVE